MAAGKAPSPFIDAPALLILEAACSILVDATDQVFTVASEQAKGEAVYVTLRAGAIRGKLDAARDALRNALIALEVDAEARLPLEALEQGGGLAAVADPLEGE